MNNNNAKKFGSVNRNDFFNRSTIYVSIFAVFILSVIINIELVEGDLLSECDSDTISGYVIVMKKSGEDFDSISGQYITKSHCTRDVVDATCGWVDENEVILGAYEGWNHTETWTGGSARWDFNVPESIIPHIKEVVLKITWPPPVSNDEPNGLHSSFNGSPSWGSATVSINNPSNIVKSYICSEYRWDYKDSEGKVVAVDYFANEPHGKNHFCIKISPENIKGETEINITVTNRTLLDIKEIYLYIEKPKLIIKSPKNVESGEAFNISIKSDSDNGKPVNNANVVITFPNGSVINEKTDENGRIYDVKSCESGDIHINASKEYFISAGKQIVHVRVCKLSITTLPAEVKVGDEITIKVTDNYQESIPDASISIWFPNGSTIQGSTNEQGIYKVVSNKRGNMSVKATKECCNESEEKIVSIEPLKLDITFIPTEPKVWKPIIIKVTDERNILVGNATITIRYLDGSSVRNTTNKDGKTTFVLNKSGNVTIIAEKENYINSEEKIVGIEPLKLDITFIPTEPKTWKSFTIKVTDERNILVGNATITIRYLDGSSVRNTTNKEGKTTFVLNKSGNVTITAEKEEYISRCVNISAVKQNLSIHNLTELKTNKPFELIVKDEDDFPIPNVSLTIIMPDGEVVKDVTDYNGTVKASSALNGTMQIKSEKEGYKTSEKSIPINPQKLNITLPNRKIFTRDKVEIRISDEDHNPVSEVHVLVFLPNGINMSKLTDKNGVIKTSSDENGTIYITACKRGYECASRELPVEEKFCSFFNPVVLLTFFLLVLLLSLLIILVSLFTIKVVVKLVGWNVPDLEKQYLFSWDDVLGNDSERLLKFLKDDLKIEWVENAKIEKSDNGKAITITKGKNSLIFKLDEKGNKVNLEIRGVITHKYISREENGKLNIYEKHKELAGLLPLCSIIFGFIGLVISLYKDKGISDCILGYLSQIIVIGSMMGIMFIIFYILSPHKAQKILKPLKKTLKPLKKTYSFFDNKVKMITKHIKSILKKKK